MDEGIVHLDSPVEPWSVHLELQLRGALDETRLRDAVGVALDRHPRARARLVTGSWPHRRFEWEITPTPDLDPFAVVDSADDDALARAREDVVSRPLLLEASPPLRLRLVRHPRGDTLLLNLHHAAGDAMAGLVFLQSVARAYAGRPEVVGGAVVAAPSGAGLRRVLRELLEAARPSASIAPDGGRDGPGYALRLVRVDAARTRALRDRAGNGTTVNDLLVAALHLTVDRWNAEHGRPARRVSILVPVNLRPRSRWREGFANVTFMLPVATLPRQRISAAGAVGAVRRRTGAIKEDRLPAAVVGLLRRLEPLPLAARRRIARLAARGRRVPTTLLSNLGRLEHDLDFGPGVGAPVHVWFSPPAKIPLGLAVGAVTVDEELHLAFRVRHPLLGDEALATFAAYYQAALDGLVAADDRRVGRAVRRLRAA
ncbi:MAG TPA: condensation domain-containing protein [Acidimicrobiales bacterium]|nr:condensation domain-containing protein [Acidimicrobiales bacterium]